MVLNNGIMETTVKERIVKFLEFKKIGQGKFEAACGLSNGYISGLKKAPGADKLLKIISTYPELSQDWLLKGEGEMLVSNKSTKQEGIPLIPVNAVAGFLSGVGDPIMEYDCERYIMPIFKGADFLIRVEGDSMMPNYMPGDIVACVKLDNPSFFQPGKVYVIDTKQGALVKRVELTDEEDRILLHSDNEKYKPFSLHSDEINGIAIVKGVIRVE